MSLHTIIVNPCVVVSFTGHVAYEVGPRYVWRLNVHGRRVSRVLRSKLPTDFGSDIRSGAFGMADAYNTARSAT